MPHEDEYHDSMVALLEMIWGEGFMAPGCVGNLENLIGDLEIRDQRVLDYGCGVGGPAMHLAQSYGARVVGIDIEPDLVERARSRAAARDLGGRVEFVLVEPGPLEFPDESFDIVVSSGAFTQIDNKRELFAECFRVLRPGGTFTCDDWMKPPGEYSEDMLYWIELEGLTYAMRTPQHHEEALHDVGFIDVAVDDRSEWYRREAHVEYEKMRTDLYSEMVSLLGADQADHFVENWRMLTVVCDKGEMLQVYCRGTKPTDS
ncbi:MAG TPA: methyltransferase domain-containing protein [Acidobacteriota bacterium]|nr:methyltransferase domain-containing protein [Acidobacteriota bacterium]